jgi:ferritin-like metal-binding protein YciE
MALALLVWSLPRARLRASHHPPTRESTMKIPSIEKLLEDQLKDLYNAENQLVKALPKMAKAASSEGLREAFSSHLEETRGQVKRLDRIGKLLGIKLSGKKCVGMEGLIEEGKEIIEADGQEGVLDLGLIAGAQKVEHYEISAYGSARALAEQLGQSEVAALLQETLDEESAADEKLTGIAMEEVMPTAEAGEAEEVMAAAAPRNGSRRRR